jgi:uncharacterized DUF497 family protein
MILFEWDEAKAKSNSRKHGVSFELARLAFADPFAISEQNRIVDGELRWRTIASVASITVSSSLTQLKRRVITRS